MGSCGSKSQVSGFDDDVRILRSELANLTKDSQEQHIEEPKTEDTVQENTGAVPTDQIIIKSDTFSHLAFFAIGDIESCDNKLETITAFIKDNPTRDFVFLGDIIDDLSWNCNKKDNGLRCLRLLDENGLLDGGLKFNEIKDFSKLKFPSMKYNEISNRVKFVIGNAERDLLLDLINAKKVTNDSSGYLRFAGKKHKWFKKFTHDELALIYKYLSCCYGSIMYKISNRKTLYIRHAWSTFKNETPIVIDQRAKTKPSPKTPVLCGHDGGFGVYQANTYMNDTSSDINDCRICSIAVINHVMQVGSLSLTFAFPGKTNKHSSVSLQCSPQLLLSE